MRGNNARRSAAARGKLAEKSNPNRASFIVLFIPSHTITLMTRGGKLARAPREPLYPGNHRLFFLTRFRFYPLTTPPPTPRFPRWEMETAPRQMSVAEMRPSDATRHNDAHSFTLATRGESRARAGEGGGGNGCKFGEMGIVRAHGAEGTGLKGTSLARPCVFYAPFTRHGQARRYSDGRDQVVKVYVWADASLRLETARDRRNGPRRDPAAVPLARRDLAMPRSGG